MRIGDTLKKAAGLIVEFDEPDPETEFYKTKSTTARPPAPNPVGSSPGAAGTVPKAGGPAPADSPAPSAPRTVEQVVRDSPGPNLDQVQAPASPGSDVARPDGTVDFGAIYRLAALPPAPFSAEQVLELLGSLPSELPIETKRATVRVTLNAMTKSLGVTSDTIVADASRKLAALATYTQSYAKLAEDLVQKSEAEIVSLEQEIARRRQTIADAKRKQTLICDACHSESDRLDDILEFFTLDVSPSKYAPGDPSKAPGA